MRCIVPLAIWVQDNQYRATLVFRLQTPETMVPPWSDASITSACPDATSDELTALRAGTWRERVISAAVITLVATDADIQMQLLAGLQQEQLALDLQAPLKRYIAASWDGSSWDGWPA